MVTTAQSPDTLASRFLHWCAQAWEATTEADVIGSLDDETLREIARDCCITPDQILQLVKAGPHAADEMVALMKALNIDANEVSLAHPGQFRDMQITCSNCTSKERCRRDLARHAADQEYIHYCGNAEHLSGMRADPELLVA
ncbi:hypothetical protein REJC140_03128 [Pseudorhizobium endolithicum]|uniref:DUF6455 domain-containing protein n=1 Tax=Pseudorhizobium endolithicum TaxID=1191678 RepID=A0ABM8PJA2_9HYPH|nr:DUF6455 family protein [Pseudorhizobium endolithicum]CAD7032990.1 hypothetical protein REJC140_03128 [Pseudorhizobium endolithicum]